MKPFRARAIVIRDRLNATARDDRGTVLIVTAMVMPVLLLSILGGTTVMSALAKRQQLQAIAQAACNRAVKPLRMVTLDDAARQARAQKVFDDLAKERNLTIASRTVTAGWLESRVIATATVPVMSGYGKQVAVTVSADESCAGIPPYPVLNEVVLSSNFKTPTGNNVAMQFWTWGVFTPQQIGWDGGTGSGVELQDWSTGVFGPLPNGVSNPYVVELDSGPLTGAATLARSTCGVLGPTGYNSSMFKNFELHPGVYRFSLWYRARVSSDSPIATGPHDTNKLVLYLEGTRPVITKQAYITMDDYDTSWRYRSVDLPISSYGLYKIYLAAEGCADGTGGNFNDLKLTYIKRPYPEYND
jgi:Flp pilus assembly protein TadG